jgi:hypothetical protein
LPLPEFPLRARFDRANDGREEAGWLALEGLVGQAGRQLTRAGDEDACAGSDPDLTLLDGLPCGQGLDGAEADKRQSKGRSDHGCGVGCVCSRGDYVVVGSVAE